MINHNSLNLMSTLEAWLRRTTTFVSTNATRIETPFWDHASKIASERSRFHTVVLIMLHVIKRRMTIVCVYHKRIHSQHCNKKTSFPALTIYTQTELKCFLIIWLLKLPRSLILAEAEGINIP